MKERYPVGALPRKEKERKKERKKKYGKSKNSCIVPTVDIFLSAYQCRLYFKKKYMECGVAY